MKGTSQSWVVCKGVLYDVSKNTVFNSGGSSFCFSGKDATIALGKMMFIQVGERGWQSKLNYDELAVVDEWVKWFSFNYTKVGYLKEDYANYKDLKKKDQ